MEWVTGADIGIVRVAEWERNEWLRHGFSTRGGGVSTVYSAGYGELNLGWTKEDDPACVREDAGVFCGLLAEKSLASLV